MPELVFGTLLLPLAQHSSRRVPEKLVSAYDWMRLVLVEFLVPIAWPLVVLVAVMILRSQLGTLVGKVGYLVDRVVKGEVGPVKVDFLPAPQDKVIPPG